MPARTVPSGLRRSLPVLWIVLALACACTREPAPVGTPSAYPAEETLSQAALDTVIRFNQARSGGAERIEVPEEFWAPEIAALEPRGVYWHNNNLVVLSSASGSDTDGFYIYVLISSYMPPDGETMDLQVGQELVRLVVIR